MVNRWFYKLLGLILVFVFTSSVSFAQCAMCKAAAEQATTGEGGSYNSGILYLMAFPYILFFFLGFFWYRQSKKNRERKEQIERQIKKHVPSYSPN